MSDGRGTYVASPQPEDGGVLIAYSLWVALGQARLTGLQWSILDVILNLTYGAKKKTADISTDDIRYQIAGKRLYEAERIEKALAELVSRNIVVQNGSQIGIQKDFEKWTSLGGITQNVLSINNNTLVNSYSTTPHKMRIPQLLLNYVQAKSNIKLKGAQVGIELGNARRLYALATQLSRVPAQALLSVRDYLDYMLEDAWVQLHVTMKFTFALSRYEAWFKQIPKKPKNIRDTEELTGRRFRWNHDSKKWEKTDDRTPKSDT